MSSSRSIPITTPSQVCITSQLAIYRTFLACNALFRHTTITSSTTAMCSMCDTSNIATQGFHEQFVPHNDAHLARLLRALSGRICTLRAFWCLMATATGNEIRVGPQTSSKHFLRECGVNISMRTALDVFDRKSQSLSQRSTDTPYPQHICGRKLSDSRIFIPYSVRSRAS